MADTKIKISVKELELMLSAFRNQIIENISQNIGSYETIQKLRSGKDLSNNWKAEELKLKSDIELIGTRTEFPSDFRTLKRYLSD